MSSFQTLNRLAALVRRDPQWFSKFVKKGDLFKQFERLLEDDRWEVQHQCIKLLHEALPTFGNVSSFNLGIKYYSTLKFISTVAD